MKISDTFSFSHIITEKNLSEFISLSGDDHPLHQNGNYARIYGFQKKIVPGMLVAMYLSQLVGKYFPKQNYFYLSQTLTFHHPVYVGTLITITATCEHVSDTTGIATLETIIIDEFKRLIVSGQMRVKQLQSAI